MLTTKKSISWFRSYLFDRTQYYSVKIALSEASALFAESHKAVHLAQMLFLLFKQ